jgi:preprotein translocase subunit SecE
MVTKSLAESRSKKVDFLLWAAAVALFSTGCFGYYFFANSLLVKVLGLIIMAAMALYVASRTEFGEVAVRYCQDALIELKKVVWPTKQETIQTTIAVLVMIFAMGIFLWVVDLILLKLVAKILY